MAKLINGITPEVRRAVLTNASALTSSVSAVAALVSSFTGITGTTTFYASSTSGGTCDVLNTVAIEEGRITSWTQAGPSGTPGGWKFNDADNSGHMLMATWE